MLMQIKNIRQFLSVGMQRIRRSLPASIFDFNQFERDLWMTKQAATITVGSRILDVGAGSCPYRGLFVHCEYHANDFTGLQPDQLLGSEYRIIDYASDILSIPVSDASFDVILYTEVLEHCAESLLRLCMKWREYLDLVGV